jgi:hypothetical protein
VGISNRAHACMVMRWPPFAECALCAGTLGCRFPQSLFLASDERRKEVDRASEDEEGHPTKVLQQARRDGGSEALPCR